MIEKNSTLYSLLEDIYTQHEAATLMNQLGELTNSLYTTKENPLEKMDEFLPADKKEKLIDILKKSGVDSTNTIMIQSKLDEFSQKITDIPVIMLTFAYEPSIETVKKIYKWFSDSYEYKMFLDISVDEKIMGGMMLTYKGLYRDFSVRKKFNDLSLNGELEKMIADSKVTPPTTPKQEGTN